MINSPHPNFGHMLPHIVTDIPGPRARAMAAELAKLEMPTSNVIGRGDIPIPWALAQGSNVMDVDGNIYIDL